MFNFQNDKIWPNRQPNSNYFHILSFTLLTTPDPLLWGLRLIEETEKTKMDLVHHLDKQTLNMPRVFSKFPRIHFFNLENIFRNDFILYRVFIKYCVFSELFKIFRTLFSLGVSDCTHTRQVENQRCSRTGRVQKNHEILRKKHNI